jgi:hypothetical protein
LKIFSRKRQSVQGSLESPGVWKVLEVPVIFIPQRY